jgi:integrase
MLDVANSDNVKSTTDPHRAKDFLDPSEIKLFLQAAKAGRQGIRDHLLFLMMYRHGLRCSEAIDLRRDDISFDRATLWVRRLKGSNSGMHPIEGDELRAIRRYLATRTDDLPWLFISERQGKLTRFAVNYLVERTRELLKRQDLRMFIRTAYVIAAAML